jgi:hypothetical protein
MARSAGSAPSRFNASSAATMRASTRANTFMGS